MEHLYRNHEIVHDLLLLSQSESYRDVSIICRNGTFRTNSFILASVFPLVRITLDSSLETDEEIAGLDRDVPDIISEEGLNMEIIEVNDGMGFV